MAGNKEGAKKISSINRKNHGDDYYARIGRLGGSTITEKTKNKGFASMSKERRAEVQWRGGRRGKNVDQQENLT